MLTSPFPLFFFWCHRFSFSTAYPRVSLLWVSGFFFFLNLYISFLFSLYIALFAWNSFSLVNKREHKYGNIVRYVFHFYFIFSFFFFFPGESSTWFYLTFKLFSSLHASSSLLLEKASFSESSVYSFYKFIRQVEFMCANRYENYCGEVESKNVPKANLHMLEWLYRDHNIVFFPI